MSFLLGIIYLSFISLGLPDALLGAAWPNMYPEFQVPVSYAGMISMIIALGTIISSLQSDRLTRKFGTGKVTAVSVGITALALWGFSISHSFILLCLWAIPYGLGAGSVDASLNNYVALHYASKHMSWLHCMWGIGATLGPYIMGAVLTGGTTWNTGYGIISVLQIVLTAVLTFSLPKWKKQNILFEETTSEKVLSLKEILAIPGAKAIMVCFFCYCAVEQTTMLWASSYLNLAKGVDARTAASFAGMFCIGITIGRGINGFIAMKLKDRQMIRMGQAIIQAGGARLDPTLAEQVIATFDCTLQQVFGMAEGLLCFTRLDDPHATILHSQGRPLSPLDEIRIVDQDENDVAPGETGQLLTRGPYTISGYYRAPAHNAQAFTAQGFYRTGDNVRLDEVGNLHVEGRIKEQINRAGEKIAAAEVESALLRLAEVQDCAVVAAPDTLLGERICAFIIAQQVPTDYQQLRQQLTRMGLSAWKIPDQIEFLDHWPLTAVGKIDKKRLTALAVDRYRHSAQ